MAFRIEVTPKIPDARSVSKRAFFNGLIGPGRVSKVAIADCYTVDAKLNAKQIQKTAELLTNPLIEEFRIMNYELGEENKFDWALEISFLPGVTDNVGHTARETIEDGVKYKFKNGENVYSSQVFYIKFPSTSLPRLRRGISPQKERKKLLTYATTIANALHNPLIQKATIKAFADFQKQAFLPNLPKVKLFSPTKITQVDLNISDEELTKLGKLGILNRDGARRGPLALDLKQLKTIRDYFNQLDRKPTDVELESLAQTWSEHCKHIIFNSPIDDIKEGLFKRYIKGATETIRKQKGRDDFCVSVFTDNAGAIAFDKDFLITHKVETHNTPSALDPFGGAITGIVGVNRDALGFGLGAKPIINTYGFCLAEPGDTTTLYRDKKLKQPMLSARRIMDGVIAGINAGGNQSGIPTNSGFMYFDSKYRGKPLVFAGTVGLIPRKIKGKPSHIKQAQSGDYIVMVGGRVGLDGIHGATFSSESLDVHSPATAVQIGDPITQKKFTDALVREARNLGLYNSITDCGAGGLSSGVGEMAREANGCVVNLEKVPLKYPGLAPWQIWISESQERMVLALPPKNWRLFVKLMKNRGVESSIIGKFINTGKCLVKFGKQTVMDIDLEFLHNGLPIKQQNSQPPSLIPSPREQRKGEVNNKNPKSYILKLLASPNLTSNAFLATQYDHEVQGGSVLKPLQGKGQVSADATVTRPILNSNKGVVLSSALFPEYSEDKPYYMAAVTIDSAIRQAVAVGANPDQIALLDNFCWSSPEDPKRLWQLKQTAKACFDFAVAFGTPFISGKDSMYNDFKGFDAQKKAVKISIPPTLLISAIGIIEDVSKSVSLDAKIPGDLIYLLGMDTKTPDKINALKNLALYRAFYEATQKHLVASAISVNRGGLAVALCKKLIAGQLGASITLPSPDMLFAELPGFMLATINPKNTEKFEKIIAGNAFTQLGKISSEPTIILNSKNQPTTNLLLSLATQAYHSTFKNF